MVLDSEVQSGDRAHPPRKRLTDTVAGQGIFVALVILATLAVLALMGTALWWGMQSAGVPPEAQPVSVEVEDPVPSFPDLTAGARAPGVWEWSELRGGECLAAFPGAFAEEYEVVSCSTPHAAQVVIAETLSRDPDASFPGEASVLEIARDVCDVYSVIDVDLAAGYPDLQLELSYPVNASQWEQGARVAYCFVTRSSGELLSQSLLGGR